MGQPDEITFQTTDGPWPVVKEGAHGAARERIDVRYKAILQGVSDFRHSASALIRECIRTPPEDVSVFGAVADVVLVAATLVVPEVGVAAEILEAVKKSYETLKPSSELLEKIRQMQKAESVEGATAQLIEIADGMAEDVQHGAGNIEEQALSAVGAALENYVTRNPQVFRPGDDSYYGELCDAIGITTSEPEDVSMATWQQMFPPFRKKTLEVAAALHFFKEMSDDAERLNFLMDQADEGNDPDALLELIGGDRSYWDQFLSVYRSDGRDAAQGALFRHLTSG